jgi:hypothetical protein
MADASLRMLLWILGHCIAVGSRFLPALRAQITKSLTIELSAGDRVARHWVFDGPSRLARTFPGRAPHADCALHLGSSSQALRILVSRRTVDRVVHGMHHGTVRIEGSTFVVLWFHGLTRVFVRLGRPSGPRRSIPYPYLAHDPATTGAETIVVEPAVVRLDPAWTAAWRARSTLWNVRAATDEPMPEP